MQFNIVHILPQSKIPFSSLPIDILITQKASFLKQQYEAQMEEIQKAAAAAATEDKKSQEKKDKPLESMKADFTTSGLLTIDEYKFPHAIFVFDSPQNELGFETAFTKCA